MGLLEVELKYFDDHRQQWFESSPYRFALIDGNTLYGFYDTWRDAYEAGMEKIGLDGFLIKQVLLVDEVSLMANM